MFDSRLKPAFIALSIVLIAWCFFLTLHNESVLGGFVLVLLGMGVMLMTNRSPESKPRMELRLHEISSLDHSHAELHELQRTLCTLEIDLEKDISRLSKRYADIKFD